MTYLDVLRPARSGVGQIAETGVVHRYWANAHRASWNDAEIDLVAAGRCIQVKRGILDGSSRCNQAALVRSSRDGCCDVGSVVGDVGRHSVETWIGYPFANLRPSSVGRRRAAPGRRVPNGTLVTAWTGRLPRPLELPERAATIALLRVRRRAAQSRDHAD